jgi:hypothetical protein
MAQTLDLNRLHIRRGQPILAGPGVALPASTVPLLPGYVRFTTTSGPLMSLDMLTYSEPYMLADGYAAGWDSVPRQNRLTLPKWTSGGLLRQAVPITMDVLARRALDIHDAWNALQEMARPTDGTRPPTLRIAGPVDHRGYDWVIVGFAPDEASTKRRGSVMVRQNVLVTLGQWVDIKAESKLKSAKPAKDKPRSITTGGQVNTLKRIAKHYLHDAKRWKEIAKLNKGLHDPDRRIPPNTKVWIPPK